MKIPPKRQISGTTAQTRYNRVVKTPVNTPMLNIGIRARGGVKVGSKYHLREIVAIQGTPIGKRGHF